MFDKYRSQEVSLKSTCVLLMINLVSDVKSDIQLLENLRNNGLVMIRSFNLILN